MPSSFVAMSFEIATLCAKTLLYFLAIIIGKQLTTFEAVHIIPHGLVKVRPAKFPLEHHKISI